MTSLLNKLSISIKIGVIKRYGVCLVSFQIVDRIRRQSSWASCELCSHHRRRCDKTVSWRRRRRCVLCLTHCSKLKITSPTSVTLRGILTETHYRLTVVRLWSPYRNNLSWCSVLTNSTNLRTEGRRLKIHLRFSLPKIINIGAELLDLFTYLKIVCRPMWKLWMLFSCVTLPL